MATVGLVESLDSADPQEVGVVADNELTTAEEQIVRGLRQAISLLNVRCASSSVPGSFNIDGLLRDGRDLVDLYATVALLGLGDEPGLQTGDVPESLVFLRRTVFRPRVLNRAY